MKKIAQTFLSHVDDVKLLGFTKAAILAKIRFSSQLNSMQKNEYFCDIGIEELCKCTGGSHEEISDALWELLEDGYVTVINNINVTINHDLLPYYDYEIIPKSGKFKYNIFEDDGITLRRGKYKGYNFRDVTPDYKVWLLENVLLSSDERKYVIQSLILHFGDKDTSQWKGVNMKDGTSKEIMEVFVK